MITGEQKQTYLDFFNRVLDLDLALTDLKMITQLKDGEVMAVVGFFNSSQYNIELCVASQHGFSATKRLIKECCFYAFVTCNAWRITSYVRTSNLQSIYFHSRLGAKREFDGVLKNWFGYEDGLQFVLLRQDCTWL